MANNNDERIFGIDLGTTNSCIAVVEDDGEPRVLANFLGYDTTPSVVYYDPVSSVVLVGNEAKQIMGGDAENAVAFIKREIGNKDYKRTINGEQITPLKISAMILKKVVSDANELLESEGCEPIHKAVITVPAYFGSTECEITRQAGEIAGLEVLRLIPEPTAAAISYGVKDLEGKTFMIYDLGGGTFDVSIMRMKNGRLEELSNDGDHRLGGVDWDIELANYAFRLCELDIEYGEIAETKDAGNILIAAETAKKALSNKSEINMRFIYKRRPYVAKITREEFEDLMSDHVDQTIMLMQRAIKNSRVKLTSNDIQEIILVGGSSFMPMIRRAVSEAFPNAVVRLDRMKPNLAVAEGAAIYAKWPLKEEAPVMVSPCSYGVGCFINDKKVNSHVILKDDPYGTIKKDQFSTRMEGQTSLNIEIYTDRSVEPTMDIMYCTRLASKPLSWGHPVPKGTTLNVVFHLTEDGILKVTGECQGKVVDFTLEVQGASQSEIDDARRDLNNKTIG